MRIRELAAVFMVASAIIYLLLVAFILTVEMALAHEPDAKVKDYNAGCHINAVSIDDGKDTTTGWEVVGWVKYPKIKLIEEYIGSYPKMVVATEECQDWMQEQMLKMPIPLTEPATKPKGEVKYARN